jgi:hypothetical protein
MFFFSAPDDGRDSLADGPLPNPPTAVFIAEVGVEGNNGAFYTPLANDPNIGGGPDPGFRLDGQPVTYHFISDGNTFQPAVEPDSLMLLGAALIGSLGWQFLRRSTHLAFLLR